MTDLPPNTALPTPAEPPAEAPTETPADGEAEAKPEVGVGPWEGEWPVGEHWDPDLLRDGDRRNVVDQYRYWKHEAIVADLDSKRHEFHIAIENWQHDLNIGTVVRTANAFLAKEVHIIGRRRWNRRGAMVTDRYQHVRHHPTVEDFVQWAEGEGLAVIGIDIFPDSVPLETYDLPEKCVLVFGQEGPGLTPEVHDAAVATLSIEQFGSTRSMNAASAAAIAMHAWVRRHVFQQPVS
ncbi:TrmH family RNA methyltransferase [Paenarthrobacter sp. NPDC092416]|uniref:TrmH family RNA methyltransferase n=1 Tax=Paenarthrobacter sp. NPDC092416 TaxID=3364386 RepID=UPI0038101F9F